MTCWHGYRSVYTPEDMSDKSAVVVVLLQVTTITVTIETEQPSDYPHSVHSHVYFVYRVDFSCKSADELQVNE